MYIIRFIRNNIKMKINFKSIQENRNRVTKNISSNKNNMDGVNNTKHIRRTRTRNLRWSSKNSNVDVMARNSGKSMLNQNINDSYQVKWKKIIKFKLEFLENIKYADDNIYLLKLLNINMDIVILNNSNLKEI